MVTPPTQLRNNAKFHVYMKEWMVFLDVSDDRMAERINLSGRSAVWKLYTEQRFDLDRVKQVAEALGISWQRLLRPPPKKDAADDADSQSVDAWLDELDPRERRRIVGAVRRLIGD